jgi:hypothetical protein
MLKHAEHMLDYAVEAGIELDADVAQRIIAARRLGSAIWDDPEVGALIAAITKLAAKLHPVTAETLRACRDDAKGAIRLYRRFVYVLAVIIIPLSVISFICTAISNSITADLNTANSLIVTLHTQLDSSTQPDPKQVAPPGSLAEAQQFAALMRAIYSRAQQLDLFVPYKRWKSLRPPFGGVKPDTKAASLTAPLDDVYAEMQLPADLGNLTVALQSEVEKLTTVYQNVRLFATESQDDTSMVWGALSVCILPVLYALLGACAYVLRTFSEQTERRTFARSHATPARFIIAAIGGEVVGLFTNFTFGQGPSLPPLALAFLVGYATDIFFSFLEGSMPNLRAGKTP